MGDAPSFDTPEAFVAHLRQLRFARLISKTTAEKPLRRHLSATERQEILEKTGGLCHLCGGKIDGAWTANHVRPYAYEANESIDNYLPCHAACNRARWFYGDSEFRWILKLGVFFRTQLEEKGNEHAIELARAFLEQEAKNVSRRKFRSRKRTI